MRYSKVKAVEILMVLALLSPLTACQAPEQEIAIYQSQEQHKDNQNPAGSEVVSLSEIKPVFKPYGQHTAIDEQSVLKIVKLAMADAYKFYDDMGAPNMTYDKNLAVVKQKSQDKFYPEWMNEYFFMARAMSESSFRVDCITEIPNSSKENYAHGIMQIRPDDIKSTLEQYYQSIFGVSLDLTDLKVVPTKEDLEAVYYSKEAQANVVQAVYNNIYLSICYDIYSAKCLNPVSHTDYYSSYGGFNERERKLAVTMGYTAGNGWAISGLKSGDLREEAQSIPKYKTYLSNMEKHQNQFEEKYENSAAPQK